MFGIVNMLYIQYFLWFIHVDLCDCHSFIFIDCIITMNWYATMYLNIFPEEEYMIWVVSSFLICFHKKQCFQEHFCTCLPVYICGTSICFRFVFCKQYTTTSYFYLVWPSVLLLMNLVYLYLLYGIFWSISIMLFCEY